jgi:hypothetical protein
MKHFAERGRMARLFLLRAPVQPSGTASHFVQREGVIIVRGTATCRCPQLGKARKSADPQEVPTEVPEGKSNQTLRQREVEKACELC